MGLGALGAAAIFAFATSACGGSSNAVAQIGSGTTTTTVGASAVPGSPGSKAAGAVAYSACMRAHGIAGFPDPVFTAGKVLFPLPAGMNANSSQFEAAREICQKLIPAGLPYSN